MSFTISQVKDQAFVDVLNRVPILVEYLDTYTLRGRPIPIYAETLSKEHEDAKKPNIIYPLTGESYVHINPYTDSNDGYIEYVLIEPKEPDQTLMEMADKSFAANSKNLIPPTEITERFNMIEEYTNKTFIPKNKPVDYSSLGDPFLLKTIPVYKKDMAGLKYYFLRRRAGMGILDPFLADPYLEDISIVGKGNLYVVHKIFGALKCSMYLSNEEIDDLVVNMSEQFGKTISHTRPIVDAQLPEGSRINIVFGKDISRKGTNTTIRRFASTPLSITQILESKTMSYLEAAYMWMILNEGMSIFINGETASGKTTSLMALTAFIPSNWKIVSIEDTPEISLPHTNWINEATRDTGKTSSSVTMFDLLKASLRQRPNYILVGEIRGAEGSIAFQAMQTGHPVISTFHSENMVSMIQRLTNDPINIPKTHMENLNVAMFQAAVMAKGGKRVRRVLSINEIIGYNSVDDNMMFIPIFEWEPGTDSVKFRGRGSSALFTNRILRSRGMRRRDEVLLYQELELRSQILKQMVEKKIFNFYDVFDSISHCRDIGLEEYSKDLDSL